MSKKDWQVGPVLKDKLGSQGTLFSGGTRYSSDARYPKGYTPERFAAVADAVIRSTKRNVGGNNLVEARGIDSMDFGDRKVRTGSGSMSEAVPMAWQSNQENRNVVDTVARSTVPLNHLNGVQWRTNASAAALGKPTVAGHYDRRGDALTTNGEAVIRLREGASTGTTPIHEIGHHVSHQFEENQHDYDETGHSGPEEAWADNYAEQHYRDRKGKPIDHGIYGGGRLSGNIERTDEFWNGYSKNRHMGEHAAYVERENEKYYDKYPEERVHADNSQDVPLITKDYAPTGEEHTTHQPMEINWEAKYDDRDSGHGFDWSKYRHGR